MPRAAELKAWEHLPAPPAVWHRVRGIRVHLGGAGVVALPARRPRPARALSLVGVPLEIEVSALLAFGLAAWTLADAVLPELVPGSTPLAYWTAGALGSVLLLVSGLVHEVAHCVASRRVGVPPRRVRLLVFGGVTELTGAPRSPGALCRVALAGPLASLLLGLGAALVHLVLVEAGVNPLGQMLAAVLAVANIAVAGLNLIPGLPLDGGAILEAALWRLQGTTWRAERVARAAGRMLGGVLIVLAVLASTTGYVGTALWLSLIGFVITQQA